MNAGVWDDEKRKALKKLQTSKVLTKMTDMNQDLRLETTEIVTMAVEKYCSVGQYEVRRIQMPATGLSFYLNTLFFLIYTNKSFLFTQLDNTIFCVCKTIGQIRLLLGI